MNTELEPLELLELAGDLVCTASAGGYFCQVSDGWEKTLGYSAAELTSRPYIDFVHPDDREATAQQTSSLRTPGAAVRSFENRYRHRDGTYRSLLWVAKSDSDGMVHAIARDVTDQRRKERALKVAEARFDDAFDHSPIGLALVSACGEFLRVNNSLCDLLGLSPAELLESTLQSVTDPADRDAVADQQRRMAAGELDTARDERSYVRADGSHACALTNVLAIREGEELNHFVVSFVDITARKLAEQDLQRANTQNAAILRSAAEGIYGLDLEGHITFFNPAAEALTGWDADAVLGRRAHDVLRPAEIDGPAYGEQDCPICGHLAVAQHEQRSGSAAFHRPDDGSFPVEFTSTPLRIGDEVAGAVVTFRDISERQRATDELKRYAENLAVLAMVDPVTKLGGGREFHAALARATGTAERDGWSVAVILCELSNAGRPAADRTQADADEVHLEFARALRAVSSGRCTSYRLGRNRFALIVTRADERAAISLTERLDELVRGQQVAFGTALFPQTAQSAEELLRMADRNLAERSDAVNGGPSLAFFEGDRAATGHAVVSGGGSRAAAERRAIEQVLTAARAQLGMELAHFSAFEGGRQVFRAVQGGDSFGLGEGDELDLEGTYCQRVVDGRLPNLVRDARSDPETKDLPLTVDAGIGSYAGVPVVLSDGRLYGTLCCVDHDEAPGLDERDLNFMHTLAAMLGSHVEHLETEAQRRHLAEAAAKMAGGAASTRALIVALETRDHYTGSHSEAVVDVARDVAESLGLSPDQVREVEQTALLHDIGKVGVPDAVLQKPGPLDDLEWKVMREHPAIGARLVASIPSLDHLAPAIRAEHERWDGQGYPDGLSGEAIPLASRIGFACDAFHAMTSDRPYRTALPKEEAVRELEAHAGSQFDPAVIDALVRIVRGRR